MSKVLLDLDTLIERPKIKIDGQLHEILAPDELPVLTSHLLATGGSRFDALMKDRNLSDDGKAELRSLLHTLSDTVMQPIAAEVRAKLSDAQRVSVIEAFTALLLSKRTGTAVAMLAGLLPTGEKSSPGSNASTAAGRSGGSGKRRSRS